MDHVFIIKKYLDAIGGRLLIDNLKSHYLQCTLNTESFQQIWREFYNYQNNMFNISVSVNNRSLMKVDGNILYGTRFQGGVKTPLMQDELKSLHKSIKLVPEIDFLNSGFNTREIKIEDKLNEYRVQLYQAPFHYDFSFDRISFLKREVIIENPKQKDSKLCLKFSDWREVDGLYFPFLQEMIAKHLASYRQVNELHLTW